MNKCLDCGVLLDGSDDPAVTGCYANRGFDHGRVVPEQLARAIDQAEEAVGRLSDIVKPEFLTGMTIVIENGIYKVYKDSAWERPAEQGILPWPGPPTGTPVAKVGSNFAITLLEGEPA